jgi:hypothetical protein
MLTRSLVAFLLDDRGSYTIWSLVWFIMYVLIGGLAVDGTDGYRLKTALQATADSAALAAVISVREPHEDPVQVAIAYAEANMPPERHGEVLATSDVHIGFWDINTETFTEGASDPNAVYVVTRRSAENLNAVEMSFLRIAQIWGLGTWWNINADALAVVGLELCQNNGIIAGGVLNLGNGSEFYNGMCLHGVEGIKLTDIEYADPDVVASVGCSQTDQHCLRPNESLALGDPYFAKAFDLGGYGIDREPVNAQTVGNYIEMVTELASETYQSEPDPFDAFLTANSTATLDYSGLAYLANSSGQTAYVEDTVLPADAVTPLGSTTVEGKYTVYKVNCASNTSLDLPSGIYRNMAIIATCPVNMNSSTSVDMKDVMIAVDWWPGANPTTQFGMHFAGNAILGATQCGEGGVDLMTRNSSVHFAAGGQINNSRLLSGYNAKMTAGGSGVQGLHVEAVNDVTLVNGGTFGLCPLPADMVPQHLVYSLVR